MGKTRQQANLVSDGFLTTDLSNTKINHTGSLLVSASFSGSGLKVDGNIDTLKSMIDYLKNHED